MRNEKVWEWKKNRQIILTRPSSKRFDSKQMFFSFLLLRILSIHTLLWFQLEIKQEWNWIKKSLWPKECYRYFYQTVTFLISWFDFDSKESFGRCHFSKSRFFCSTKSGKNPWISYSICIYDKHSSLRQRTDLLVLWNFNIVVLVASCSSFIKPIHTYTFLHKSKFRCKN